MLINKKVRMLINKKVRILLSRSHVCDKELPAHPLPQH